MKKLELLTLALVIVLLLGIVAVTGVFYYSFLFSSPTTAHVVLSAEPSASPDSLPKENSSPPE